MQKKGFIMPKKLIFYLIATQLLLTTCTAPDMPKPLARVYDKYLYLSDVDKKMFNNATAEDSLLIIKTYVDKWVQNQLLLKLAESKLSESEKNVAQELEDYRASLLIFKYEQAFVQQKIDTVFTDDDLRKHYDENKQYFILDEPIVKALYLKMRRGTPQIEKIKKLYKSEKDEDIKDLDNLAYQAAVKYDYFNDNWIPLNIIMRQLPNGNQIATHKILPNTSLELEDEENVYLVYFREVIKRGETAPYEYATDRIKNIMFNTRRNNIIRELEQNLVADESDKGHVQFY